MFKQKLILAVFALATLLVACNDDEPIEIAETYPVELSISLPTKGEGFQYSNENKQVAAFRTDTRKVKKVVLSQSGEDTYQGTSEDVIDENTEFSFLYPASASTVSGSDTLTQVLYLDRQGGTLERLADLDYSWGTYTYDMDDENYVSTSVLTSLVSFSKFQFTENGRPIERISQVVITSPTENLPVVSTLNMTTGEVTTDFEGSMILQNAQGLSGEVYAAFFPIETALHFTVSTLDGKSYEAVLPEVTKYEAGKTYVYSDIACSVLEPARIGDYYYNDATWSTLLDENKTCVGVVYALSDLNGNIDQNLSESAHGIVVALDDSSDEVAWCVTGTDVEGIENQTVLQDTMYVGSLPYFNGTHDSFYSKEVNEQLKGVQINPSTGQISAWYSQGALSDFNGYHNTLQTMTSKGAFYARMYCMKYGKGMYGWYIPAAGELALLWTLQRTGIICNETHEEFKDLEEFGYWTSTEYDEGHVWYINFYSGMITKNSKNSSYNVRPFIQF